MEDSRELFLRTSAHKDLADFCILVDKNYQPAWVHEKISSTLEMAYNNLLKGVKTRIILEVPPRHGKSELASIKFPAWVLGKRPETEIILTTYSQDLASDFGLATRDIMQSPVYQDIFTTKMRSDTTAKAKWMTNEGGGYTAVGVGGPITGKGFNIGIVDDPIKNREEADSPQIRDNIWKWYTSTFLTREEGNGVIICIMTRWHDDDLVGRILRNDTKNEWIRVKFPALAIEKEEKRKIGDALWPEKFPRKVLLDRKHNLGPYDFSSLYQQDPIDKDAQEFKEAWFQHRELEEVKKLMTRTFVTIDTAYKHKEENDWIGVCLNMVDREGKWNLITWRLKVGPKELIDFMFKTYQEYNVETYGIEQGAYNTVIKPFLEDEMRKRNIFFNVRELKHNQMNKHLRIRGLIPIYSSHSVYHMKGMCSELEEEALRFPKGMHDDVIDATAYQTHLAKAASHTTGKVGGAVKPYYPELNF